MAKAYTRHGGEDNRSRMVAPRAAHASTIKNIN